MALAGDMHRAPNCIAELFETLSNNLPGLPVVVPLEVADVFEYDERGFVFLEDVYDLMKQGPACAVSATVLIAGLRERLARESRTQNVMLRNLALELPDVAVHNIPESTEVLLVENSELVI